MKTRNRKSGFTLVELMIVAAIIAILAAILIPLLSSNKDSAIASEAANICGSVATEMKTYYARMGTWPSKAQLAAGVIDEEIDRGRYFTWANVTVTPGAAGTGAFAVTVAGNGTTGSAGGSGFSTGVSENLTLGTTGAAGPIYSGSMVTKSWVSN
ncbi:MAG: prepilin-type N-terminal cleavage/methylation domain-containing protein [Kiritimatiellales bacterium]|nr:prepilin-type N-terminal cleavage/methylation domain-containing protein [Kiritimatiellales bacterium]